MLPLKFFKTRLRNFLLAYLVARNSQMISYLVKPKNHMTKICAMCKKPLKENNVRLNKEKCVFSKSEVMFYGHILSANGIKADPKKIDAIKNAPPPQNISEVKSLLGVAQYVFRFIPGFQPHSILVITHQIK